MSENKTNKRAAAESVRLMSTEELPTPVSDPGNLEQVSLVNQNEQPQEQIVAIPLDDVFPDPKQPRKTFDQAKHDELVGSIEKNKQWQAIRVRPHPDMPGKYMIVFGERRYRAKRDIQSRIPAENTINAVISQLTNEEALAAQIIENANREDLHPMEDALGYLTYMKESRITPVELAAKTGKQLHFINQRLKLNELIPKWQGIYLRNAIKHSVALALCVLPDKIQEELYTTHVPEKEEARKGLKVNLTTEMLSRVKGDLREATFDITDSDLVPAAGACTNCPFNSACSQLFASDVVKPMCNKLTCFQEKTDTHFQNQFEIAKNDPAVLLVYDSYDKPVIIQTLEAENVDVLKLGYDSDCQRVYEPTLPSLDNYRKQHKGKKEEEIVSGYETAKTTYEEAINSFQEKVADAQIFKAFVVYERYEQGGKYIYVRKVEKRGKDKPQKLTDVNTATDTQLQAEIDRLTGREKRNVELDREKVHSKIVDQLRKSPSMKQLPKNASQLHTTLINFLLAESLTIGTGAEVKKLIPGIEGELTLEKTFEKLSKLTRQEIAFLIRHIVFHKYASYNPASTGGYMVRKIAESLPDITIKALEEEQGLVAVKRKSRVDERLKMLKQQIQKTKKAAAVSKKGKPAQFKKALVKKSLPGAGGKKAKATTPSMAVVK